MIANIMIRTLPINSRVTCSLNLTLLIFSFARLRLIEQVDIRTTGLEGVRMVPWWLSICPIAWMHFCKNLLQRCWREVHQEGMSTRPVGLA